MDALEALSLESLGALEIPKTPLETLTQSLEALGALGITLGALGDF